MSVPNQVYDIIVTPRISVRGVRAGDDRTARRKAIRKVIKLLDAAGETEAADILRSDGLFYDYDFAAVDQSRPVKTTRRRK